MGIRFTQTAVTLVILILSGSATSAADVSFTSSVDKIRMGPGERFTLSFVLENAGMGGGDELKLPDLSKFFILSGPNQSSSYQFVNGRLSSSVTYTYILQPKVEGNYTIGTASIEVDGKIYSSQPIEIEVHHASQTPKRGEKRRSGIEEQIAGNIFLKAFIDKRRMVQGEQVNLTYKIYTRVTVNDYAIHKVPAFTGFWMEEIESRDNMIATTEIIDGEEFRVGVIKEVALFPTQSGDLEISPMEIQAAIQVRRERSRDPFDAFFRNPFGRTLNYMLRNDPLTVRVDPLPTGAPDSFKGAVGSFGMNVSLDRTRVKMDEPITLRVKISGKGNIKLLEEPVLRFPSGLESFPPKVTDEIKRARGLVSGTKTFEYLLIPRSPGNIRIDPVLFSYFDPDKKEYITIRSKAFDSVVDPSGLVDSSRPGSFARTDVELLSRDIRFIKLADFDLVYRGEFLYNSPLSIIMVIVPLLGFIGILTYVKKQQRTRSNISLFRQRRAMKKVQKRFKGVRRVMRDGDSGDFYELFSQAVWGYLGDIMNIDPGHYSIERMVVVLKEIGVSVEIIKGLEEVLEICAAASYAPGHSHVSSAEEIFRKGKKVVSGIERELR